MPSLLAWTGRLKANHFATCLPLIFQKMARDKKNYYQDTPKQIKKKIALFKQMPKQYNEYLESKKQKEEQQKQKEEQQKQKEEENQMS